MRSRNPALSDKALQRMGGGTATLERNAPWPQPAARDGFSNGAAGDWASGGAPPTLTRTDRFTAEGAIYKTAGLLVLTAATAFASWLVIGAAAVAILLPAVFVGFGIAMATIFKPAWSRFTAPVYAVVEGVVLGTLTGILESAYPGIATQAVLGTFGVLAVMLGLYRSGIIKVTQRFRFIVAAATGAIMLTYLVSIVAGFFGASFGFIAGNGPLAILFSVVVIGIAALNLALDFDFIEKASAQGLPRQMEWYAAFGLLVTLVWLYIEILRLISILQSRD